MAAAAYGLDFAAPARAQPLRVWALRAAIIAVLLAIWEIVARSGWLFQG